MNYWFQFRCLLIMPIFVGLAGMGAGCQHENALGIDDSHALVVMSVSMENLIVPEQHPIPHAIIISDVHGQTASVVLNPDWPVTEGTENLMGFIFGPVVNLFIGDQGPPRNLVGVRLQPGTYELAALRGGSKHFILTDGIFQMPVGSLFTVEKGNRAYYLGHLDARLHLRDAESQPTSSVPFPRVPDLAGFDEGTFDIEVQDWYSEDFNRLAVNFPAINQVPHEHMLIELPAIPPHPSHEVRPFPIDNYIGSRSNPDAMEPGPATGR